MAGTKMIDGDFFQFHSYLTSINSAPKLELICRIEGAEQPNGDDSLAPRIGTLFCELARSSRIEKYFLSSRR